MNIEPSQPAPAPAVSRPRVRTVDLAIAWNSVFKDPAIIGKAAIGSVLAIGTILILPLPFTLPVLLGYLLGTVRSAIAGEEQPMPEWTDFGALWLLGFKYILAYFIYLLPFFLLGGLCFGLMIGGAILGKTVEGQAMMVAGGILWYLLLLASNVVIIAMRFTLYPTVMIQLAATDDLGSAFAFAELWETFRSNPWNIILSALIRYVTGFAILLACCFFLLPAFPVWFLGEALACSALGQSHRLKLLAYGQIP